MKIEVTKQQILKALDTEPLKPRAFIHLYPSPDVPKYKNNTGCAVCAVGSILDCTIGDVCEPDKVEDIAQDLVKYPDYLEYEYDEEEDEYYDLDHLSVEDLSKKAAYLAKEGKYLSGLSSLFESIMRLDGMTRRSGLANKKARSILKKFVSKNFPKKLVLDTKKRY